MTQLHKTQEIEIPASLNTKYTGNNWEVYNNAGRYNSASDGVGFTTDVHTGGWGSNNIFRGNTCKDLKSYQYCVFINTATTGNIVE